MEDEIQNKEKKLNNLKDRSPLNFDDHEEPITDQNYHVLTGLTQDQFNDLCSYVPSYSLRHTDVRMPRMAIAILLVKLRLDLSYRALCIFFGLENKNQVTRFVDTSCSALTQYLVPKHLGFNHITSIDVTQKHTRPPAQQLLAENDRNKTITILDGTHVYVKENDNNILQRRTFSLYKGKPLAKPMMIISAGGYIVAALRPYFADGKNNDSEVTKNLLYNNIQGFRSWFKFRRLDRCRSWLPRLYNRSSGIRL